MAGRTMRLLASAIVAGFIMAMAPANASAGERINADDDGVAIQGYDPVAYFSEGHPVQGTEEHAFEWEDSRWLFSTPEHKDAFAREPRRYAPRYGGFCAGAMSRGFRAQIDPEAFAIIDGKLYLAYAKSGIQEFEENADRDIPRADTNWEKLGQ